MGGWEEKRSTGGKRWDVYTGVPARDGRAIDLHLRLTCIGPSRFTSGQQKLSKQFNISLVLVLDNPIKSESYVLHLC